MGRGDHRAREGWRAVARVTVAILLGGALLASAAEVRAQEVAAAPREERADAPALLEARGAPPAAEGDATGAGTFSTEEGPPENAPRRRAGTGSERIDGGLRLRLDDEERRLREIFEEASERELMRLFRECSELPAEHIRLGPDDLLTPSAAFLRAVSPRTQDHAPIAREGFHAWAAREARRAWRREYARDAEVRRGERRSRFSHLELWEESERVRRRIDEPGAARWGRTFPEYWESHPSAAPAPPRRDGERIEVARLGPLTLDNELCVRCDVRSLLGDDRRDRDEAERRTRASRAPLPGPEERLFDAAERAEVGLVQRGNLYGGEVLCIDARLHVSSGVGAYRTGFVRTVRGEVEWSLHACEDGRRLFTVEVEAFYQPADGDSGGALLFELVRF